ncbi:MAG: serine hydrolase domain-containing protein [Gaiellaceae bacterium]
MSGRLRLLFACIGVLLVLALVPGGCGGKSAAPAPPWLTAYAKQLMQPGVERSLVFVSDHGHDVFASEGTPPPRVDERFPIGSVTKSFTATIALQLVQEKKLRLDGTLGHYLPGVVRHGNGITIRELLQHRSGLRDQSDEAVHKKLVAVAAASPSMRPVDLLRIAGSFPLSFQPGVWWQYSNTNYIALGLIIEKVTGRTYAQELRSRILKSLGLDATSLPEAQLEQRVAWAAGAIVSDAGDVGRFFSALLSGRLLSRPMLAEMERTDPDGAGSAGFATSSNTYVGDGLGIFASDAPCGRFWGHAGAIVYWFTSVSVSTARHRAVIVAVRVSPSLFASSNGFLASGDARPLFCSSLD